MGYQNKILKCVECGNEFVFTIGEQEFFASKGLKNEPKRCRGCRAAQKEARGQPIHRKARGEAVSTIIHCDDCGNLTTVPFIPMKDRPVYCWACHLKRRSETIEANSARV